MLTTAPLLAALLLSVQDAPAATQEAARTRAQLEARRDELAEEFMDLVRSDVGEEELERRRAELERELVELNRKLESAPESVPDPAPESIREPAPSAEVEAASPPGLEALRTRLAALEQRVAALEQRDEAATSAEVQERYVRAKERTNHARERLERAEERLTTLQKNAGIVDVEAVIADFVGRRREAEERLLSEELHVADLEQELDELVARHEGLPDRVEGDGGEVPNQSKLELAEDIRSKRAQVEDRREVLAGRRQAHQRLERRLADAFELRDDLTRLEREVREARLRYERALEAMLDAEDAFNSR